MGRIEEIKKRNERRKELRTERKDAFRVMREVEYQQIQNVAVEDINILLSRLQIAEEENKLYKDWYMNTHHFDETGCEYLTIVDGKCVSCNRPIPKALEQIQKE